MHGNKLQQSIANVTSISRPWWVDMLQLVRLAPICQSGCETACMHACLAGTQDRSIIGEPCMHKYTFFLPVNILPWTVDPCHRWLRNPEHAAEIYIWCAWQIDCLCSSEIPKHLQIGFWFGVIHIFGSKEKLFGTLSTLSQFTKDDVNCLCAIPTHSNQWICFSMPGALLCYLFEIRCFPSLAMRIHGRCSQSLYKIRFSYIYI